MTNETEIVRNFDHSQLNRMNDALMQLAKKAVVVGVTHSKNKDVEGGMINLAGLLAVHEFGSRDGRIPERPAMRNSFAKNSKKYIDFNKANYRKVLAGEMTVEQAVEKLGLMAASDVQKGIGEGSLGLLANDEVTKQRKGSDTPLIDTGQLRQSISHEVRDE